MKQHTRWTRLLATPLAALMLVLAGCETTQLDEPTAAPVELSLIHISEPTRPY